MAKNVLFVYANGQRVGALTDENGIWSFDYDEQWVVSNQAFPISPAFPLGDRRVTDTSTERPVQWFFDNLLPEEGMRAALAREAKLDTSDAWGLLAYYGRESAGALTLLGEAEKEVPSGRVFLPFEQLEARIQAMPRHALTATSPKRMSAAGAQQKLLVILAGQAPDHVLYEPEGAEPSMHLLKPDMRIAGYPHSAINEFFCMRLARRMELTVPETYFLRVPSACYLIERFDRDAGRDPVARLHTLDAMQLLNKDKAYKYKNATAESLVSCIDKLGARAAARLAIFRWSIFNILVGNADAHLKNLSFFSTLRGYQLAPFYDIVSTVVYNTPNYSHSEAGERWPDCELSIPIGGATHFRELTRADLLAFAEQIGIRKSGAERELDGFLGRLERQIAPARVEVSRIAQPDAGEIRLLDAIEQLPLAEMSRALR
jgi:serine/threonine-protein kinase HipA